MGVSEEKGFKNLFVTVPFSFNFFHKNFFFTVLYLSPDTIADPQKGCLFEILVLC